MFAIGYGIFELLRGAEASGSYGIAWATLVIADLAEGASWLRALRQTRAEAAARPAARGGSTCARAATRA